MYAMPINIQWEMPEPPRGQKRKFEAAMKEAIEAPLDLWVQKMLKLHFRPSAYRRYGYKPRTKRYTERKKRVKGHHDPLVWSGHLKSRATGGGEVIKTFKGRGFVELRGTRVLNLSNKAGNPDFRGELTRVRLDEQKRMTKAYEERLAEIMNRTPTQMRIVKFNNRPTMMAA